MNLSNLFEIQRKLDEHIMEEHPELKDQNNLDWKILALQVELGECANEWRGFKKWSKDQEPRTTTKCHHCSGEGMGFFSGNQYTGFKEICIVCDGTGINDNQNPLLEEYVDCLHFILSIGLELEKKYKEKIVPSIKLNENKKSDITNQFNELFLNTTSLFISTNDEYYDFEDTIVIFSELLESFVSLGEMLGFTWEQIEQAYFEKMAINHKRQDEGY
ncbi:dUTP diphosphatase [Margalitia sp. FSL K6-0131]|uniref:dUTP diphosphatase n=1 Tax=Margalitia sp. FSL K6-0131 TaxID=2954604 RepID=UPI0030F601B9